jgi:methanogenic corrinoid protein MtbC1
MSQPDQPSAPLLGLAQLLADLQEKQALAVVRQRIERGDDPVQIIDECQAGLREVGERYQQREYFLSALIMAGEILRQIMDIVLPIVEQKYPRQSAARILVGTVQGDIHHLGKDMLLMLLRAHGFTTLDLGVDVAPENFVQAARDFQPHVIGLSALITAGHASMRKTVDALRAMMAEDGRRVPILIGGQVDEQVCRIVGADHWTTDAMEGVRLCQQLTGES